MTTAMLERCAGAIYAAKFTGQDLNDAPDWMITEFREAARACLSAALNLTPDDFEAIGYRGLNRTRDTATAAHAAFTYGIQAILTEGEGT